MAAVAAGAVVRRVASVNVTDPVAGIICIAVMGDSAVIGLGSIVDSPVTTRVMAPVTMDVMTGAVMTATVVRGTMMSSAHADTDSEEPGLGGCRSQHSEGADCRKQSKQ